MLSFAGELERSNLAFYLPVKMLEGLSLIAARESHV